MRLAFRVTTAVFVGSLLALGSVWLYATIGRTRYGDGFGSFVGPESWPAALGFAATGLAALAAVVLAVLLLVAVVGEATRHRGSTSPLR